VKTKILGLKCNHSYVPSGSIKSIINIHNPFYRIDILEFYSEKHIKVEFHSVAVMSEIVFCIDTRSIEEALVEAYKLYSTLPRKLQNKEILEDLKHIEDNFNIKDILE
jgi:hypothetical protein